MELFDTPARVVIEFSPVEVFTYSAVEMDDAIRSSGFDQWESAARPESGSDDCRNRLTRLLPAHRLGGDRRQYGDLGKKASDRLRSGSHHRL
jgi:hypothetical protein